MEVWKDIEGYEGLYQVSNNGRVRSVDRIVTVYKNGVEVKKPLKGKILKAWIAKNYYHVTLSKDGKVKAPFVHKLVARAFIKNNTDYDKVNHKDENKLNNNADNLEWCSQIYNRNYGTGEKRRVEKFMKSVEQHKRFRKAVVRCDKSGKEIQRYYSMNAAKKDGFNSPGIHSCCNGRLRTYRGYVWKYAEQN